ncbi:LmrA/YxaF family transcription factor [Streptomyces swartbergensis]|uniref:LmrA/YxaF family transcription factor n=1 Tax=Streptomyces swartbergensis TaxID=487165 RepID=UPI00382DEC53
MRLCDEEFTELLRESLGAEPDPAKALVALTSSLAEGLRESDWLDGCPVTSTAVGTAASAPGIQQAAAEAFARRRAVVAGTLVAAGFSRSGRRGSGPHGDRHAGGGRTGVPGRPQRDPAGGGGAASGAFDHLVRSRRALVTAQGAPGMYRAPLMSRQAVLT